MLQKRLMNGCSNAAQLIDPVDDNRVSVEVRRSVHRRLSNPTTGLSRHRIR